MKSYYLVILGIVIFICIIVWMIRKFLIKSNPETDLSATLITSGITLILSAFPGTKESFMSFVGVMFEKEVIYDADYVAIICGFLLIIIGGLYRHNIKDRIHILNMFGIPVQKEISDEQNIKELKLADFKVKELIIDFVDIFKIDMNEYTNQLIVEKIKKNCTAFVNRSKGFTSCFTGMAPIPYSILAGHYLSPAKTRRYFEYRRSSSCYYELNKGKRYDKYEKLNILFPNEIKSDAREVVVVLSITRKVQFGDLSQFGEKDIIKIELPNPLDNVIQSVKQLDEYVDTVVNQIENLKQQYSDLHIVHFVASIPSCVSVELGKKFALNAHRLPKIISYHFVNTATPKYPFGIVVADGDTLNIGKLVKE